MPILYHHYGIPASLVDYVVSSFLGLRVYFKYTMSDDAALNNVANYTIASTGGGYSPVTVTGVTPESGGTPSYVDLTCSDLTDGETYQLAITSGVLQNSDHTTYFTNDLTASYFGTSIGPDILTLTSDAINKMTVTFTSPMKADSRLLAPASYVFNNNLSVTAVTVISPVQVELNTSIQERLIYSLVVSTDLLNIYLNSIDENTASVLGSGDAPPAPSLGPGDPSYRLTVSDQIQLSGFNDISKPEPEQVLPSGINPEQEEDKPTSAQRLSNTKSKAKKVITKIRELEQKIDKKCAKFKVTSEKTVGSDLYQAMIRVFNEKTTTITYNHYKRALDLRRQLAAIDAEKQRKI